MRYAITLLALSLCLTSFAVEVGPYKVTEVTSGDTIKVISDTGEKTVRLLYIEAPKQSTDQKTDKSIPDGKQAKKFLEGFLPIGTNIMLWAPGSKFQVDGRQRQLAVPKFHHVGTITEDISGKQHNIDEQRLIIELIIINGFSAYSRKHGAAPYKLDKSLKEYQKASCEYPLNYWKTHSNWMHSIANKAPPPKAHDIHFPDYLEQACSAQTEESLPATLLLIENHQGILLELVWLRGKNTRARMSALQYLIRHKSNDSNLFKESIQTIANQQQIRPEEIKIAQEHLSEKK